MKPGKMSESAYKRSVLKKIVYRREEILQGIGVGLDGALWNEEAGMLTGMASATVTGIVQNIGTILTHRFVNRIAALGLEPMTAWVSLVLPCGFMESEVKNIIGEIHALGKDFGMQITGVHCESVEGTVFPVAVMTGIGRKKEASFLNPKNIKPGEDIVVTGYIGMEGAAILAYEREEELLRRYSKTFVGSAQRMLEYLSVIPEAAVAVKHGVTAMHTIETGGIFGALWETAEAAKAGLLVDLRKIPIRQEVIEVCERFGINPYRITSAGSLLMVCTDGRALVEALACAGIQGHIIGKTTQGNDRLLWNDDEKRFLEPPVMNEML